MLDYIATWIKHSLFIGCKATILWLQQTFEVTGRMAKTVKLQKFAEARGFSPWTDEVTEANGDGGNGVDVEGGQISALDGRSCRSQWTKTIAAGSQMLRLLNYGLRGCQVTGFGLAESWMLRLPIYGLNAYRVLRLPIFGLKDYQMLRLQIYGLTTYRHLGIFLGVACST